MQGRRILIEFFSPQGIDASALFPCAIKGSRISRCDPTAVMKIMLKPLISFFILAAILPAAVARESAVSSASAPPNVLLITADDLNFDSLGTYGCKVPGITPNLDRLAADGMKFNHAHVNIAVCQPSRQSIMTGRYPHTNGAPGFDPIDERAPTLQERLRDAGYLNGILGKEKHLMPAARFCWNFVATESDLADGAGIGRSVVKYHAYTREFLKKAAAEDKPFFLMANLHDPHRPFAGSQQEKASWGHDLPKFTRRIMEDESTVPGFLPDLPDIRKEIAEYYTSVFRCDQAVGAVLEALKEAGQEDNTLVMFLSDNGIAVPFAKSNCYLHSTKTPWIVRWPGRIKAGTVDSEHLVSGIDFMPTVLEALGLEPVEGMNGRSFLPLLDGTPQQGREHAFTEYHRTFARVAFPTRAVQGRRYGYLINFWAGRTPPMRMDSTSGLTFRAMQKAAEDDPELAARVRLFEHRVLEEFYDFQEDPDGLNNLIGSTEHQEEIRKMRDALRTRMEDTGDPALDAFLNRNDPERLDAFMKSL
jgi:N-sulfoglucosamine sulfohydrolase